MVEEIIAIAKQRRRKVKQQTICGGILYTLIIFCVVTLRLLFGMATITSNKRRRTAVDTLHINDLPIGILADVSAYLSQPSRAILAVAFSAPPSSSWKNYDDLMHRPSPISTAIISASQWDILDFEDIEKELANKLTDDDIYAVLKCINAHVLKKLKLCGCTNIEGHGLNPLRGSVVLEQIDISLAPKYGSQEISPGAKISQDITATILDSIISTNGCSLKYIQFPERWRRGVRIQAIKAFQDRFNRYLNSRGISCAKCNKKMGSGTINNSRYWMSTLFQNSICNDCLEPICDVCSDDNDHLYYCSTCDKDYCEKCRYPLQIRDYPCACRGADTL